MATYAIGDVQGCTQQLEQLLTDINFDTRNDQLFFAGDLVNRGPDSLGTLRLIKSFGESARLVLGNHDLHLIACFYHSQRLTKKDTFSDVLNAKDAESLINWLRHQPLALMIDDCILVHAGVYPNWDRQQTLEYAHEVEVVLQNVDYQLFLEQMYGNEPAKFTPELSGIERLRIITNILTRMRYFNSDGDLDMICKKPIEQACSDLTPWFEIKPRKIHQGYILHGHWASLGGGEVQNNVVSLDTGCVWGNKLSAWRLEDQKWFSVPGWHN